MENWLPVLHDVSDLLDDLSTDTAFMTSPAILSGGTGGELPYPPPLSVEEYIVFHLPKIDAGRFAIMRTGEAFAMCAGFEERETALAGWFKRWTHWEGRQCPTVETHANCMVMPFTRSYEEVAYEDQLAFLTMQLHNDAVVPEGVSLNMWCGGCDLHGERLINNHVYWAKQIDVEIGFRQHHKEWRRLFLDWQNV